MILVGVPLGILIAAITGFIALCTLAQINEALSIMRKKSQIPARKFQIIIGSLFSIPICWVGGHWASTAMLSSVDFSEMLPSYMTTLAALFMAIMSWPLVRLIIRVANDIGKSGT
jgi:hypothetical protein